MRLMFSCVFTIQTINGNFFLSRLHFFSAHEIHSKEQQFNHRNVKNAKMLIVKRQHVDKKIVTIGQWRKFLSYSRRNVKLFEGHYATKKLLFCLEIVYNIRKINATIAFDVRTSSKRQLSKDKNLLHFKISFL